MHLGLIIYKGCTEGDVRLQDGRHKYEGRVEVCSENVWSAVCHNSWGIADAAVVCRELGFLELGK